VERIQFLVAKRVTNREREIPAVMVVSAGKKQLMGFKASPALKCLGKSQPPAGNG
jgi:hypothetical protein